jgi:microcystin-dependent protein
MAEPFLSEIRLMSFVFAPKGWALCNGQLLPINQNEALFALLGTTFGGNATTNFALPDLRGRLPMHVGNGHPLGDARGEAAHTLSTAEMPKHTHLARTATTANAVSPADAYWASPGKQSFRPSPNSPMSAQQVLNTGGSQPHLNLSPFLTLSFCIALEGIFPSPT